MTEHGRIDLRTISGAGSRRPPADDVLTDELRLALETRRELGAEYEPAIVESLVERLRDAIDDQVAAAVEESMTSRSARSRRTSRSWAGAFLGATSTMFGVGATAIISSSGDGGATMTNPGAVSLLSIWGAVVAVNLIGLVRRG